MGKIILKLMVINRQIYPLFAEQTKNDSKPGVCTVCTLCLSIPNNNTQPSVSYNYVCSVQQPATTLVWVSTHQYMEYNF